MRGARQNRNLRVFVSQRSAGSATAA